MKFPFQRQPQSDGYHLDEAFRGLRNQVLNLNPEEIGLSSNDHLKVWGMVMETGYAKAVVTLLALADSTVSLYFSNGGGIIGVGQHEGPAKAGQDLVSEASGYVADCQKVEDYPLPKENNTRFYLLTFSGVFSTEAPEEDFGNYRHKLSPLFHTAHALIHEIRVVDQNR